MLIKTDTVRKVGKGPVYQGIENCCRRTVSRLGGDGVVDMD
jgi:hypothetical protein